MSEDLEFHGMDEFKAKLTQISDEYADTSEKHLNKAGNKLKKMAKENSPLDTDPKKKKHIQKSWKSTIVGMSGSELEYQLRNVAPHYHLVENGHAMVTHNGRVIGFVQGSHFFDRCVKEYEASGEVSKEFEKYMKDIAKKLE